MFAVKTRWRWKHRRWSQTWFGSEGFKLYQLSDGLDLISHILCILIEISFVWISYFWIFILLFMLFSFGQSFFVLLFLFYSSCWPYMKCKVLFIIIRFIIFGLWMLDNKPGCRLGFFRRSPSSGVWRVSSDYLFGTIWSTLNLRRDPSACGWMDNEWRVCWRWRR